MHELWQLNKRAWTIARDEGYLEELL